MRATKNRSLTTASAGASGRASRSEPALAPPAPPGSVALFTEAEPVLVPLGDVRERREIAHPVQVHEPVEMVGLVLDDAREEVLGDEIERPALAVEAMQAHRRVAGMQHANIRHGAAACHPRHE